MSSSNRFIPYLLLVTATLCWAGNFVVGRAIESQIPPLVLSFSRTFLGLLIILPFAWSSLVEQRALIRKHLKLLITLGVLGVAGFNSCLYVALQTTTATNAALLASVSPMIILLLSFFWLKIAANRYQILGVLLSLLGVVVIISRADWQVLQHLSLNQGDLWVLLAVLMWAIYSVLLRWRPAELHWLPFLTVLIISGVIALFPLFVWALLHAPAWELSPPVLASIGYTTFFPLLLAYVCWNQAVHQVGANLAGQFLHLIPTFGTLLSIWLLGEQLHQYHIAGIALVVAGILLATVWAGRLAR